MRRDNEENRHKRRHRYLLGYSMFLFAVSFFTSFLATNSNYYKNMPPRIHRRDDMMKDAGQ